SYDFCSCLPSLPVRELPCWLTSHWLSRLTKSRSTWRTLTSDCRGLEKPLFCPISAFSRFQNPHLLLISSSFKIAQALILIKIPGFSETSFLNLALISCPLKSGIFQFDGTVMIIIFHSF